MAGEELPPVVAVVQADISRTDPRLEAALAALRAFGREEATATATVDTKPALAGVAEVEAAVKSLDGAEGTATATIDDKPALAGVAEVEAAVKSLDATSGGPHVELQGLGSALAGLSALRAATDALGDTSAAGAVLRTAGLPAWASVAKNNIGWDYNLGRWRQMSGQFATQAQLAGLLSGMSGGEKSSIPSDALLALEGAAAGHGGGGGGAGGLLAGFGGKGLGSLLGFGGLFGLAHFGSIAGLAGLGPEHLLMTGVGLAGSASGALLGGGALALGSLATMGVGMGTDLAGIGQAGGDIQQYNRPDWCYATGGGAVREEQHRVRRSPIPVSAVGRISVQRDHSGDRRGQQHRHRFSHHVRSGHRRRGDQRRPNHQPGDAGRRTQAGQLAGVRGQHLAQILASPPRP